MRSRSTAHASSRTLTHTLTLTPRCHHTKVNDLRIAGATALGPALAISIGIAGGLAGSRIILFTDGLANTGLGAIPSANCGAQVPFYMDVARKAAEMGVTVGMRALYNLTEGGCILLLLGLNLTLTLTLSPSPSPSPTLTPTLTSTTSPSPSPITDHPHHTFR